MSWDIWLIFFVLGVVVPWRGHARLRELLAKPEVHSRERLSLYLSTILFQWLAAGIVGWRAWAHGFSAWQLGLQAPRSKAISVAILGAALLGSLQWLNLRRVGRMPRDSRGQLQKLAERILPRSPSETLCFFALAMTAGLCEEFLYRGFAMAVFDRAGLRAWLVVLASAILFGLAHLYQGRGGFVSTMILGVLFGVARLTWQSLAPVTAAHWAVDVVAGIAGPKYLLATRVVENQFYDRK
jgi:membrane protease YdiL (CAAX protease family)